MMKLTVTALALTASITALAAQPGQQRWIPAGSTLTFENVGSQSSEFLRFDFKTQPIASSNSR